MISIFFIFNKGDPLMYKKLGYFIFDNFKEK